MVQAIAPKSDYREKVEKLAREKGALLPIDVAKALNTNTILASAMLSEMSSKGLLKISNLKIGTSPLYIHPERKEILEQYITALNEKDRETCNTLKNAGILRDNEQTPLIRVSLRNIKDYAVPLDVTINGAKETLWKWHLIDNKTAESMIREIMEGTQKINLKTQQTINAQTQMPETTLTTSITQSLSANKINTPEILPAQQTTAIQTTAIQQTIKTQKSQQILAETTQTQQPQKQKLQKRNTQTTMMPETALTTQEIPSLTMQTSIFLEKIQQKFNKNNILIKTINENKKNSEYSCIIEFNTPVGILQMFCKAYNKDKIAPTDIAEALMESQIHRLPLLIVANDITKKAETTLTTNHTIKFMKLN